MSTLVEGPLVDGRGVAAESLPSVLVIGAASERADALEDVTQGHLECLRATHWEEARALLVSEWIGLVVVELADQTDQTGDAARGRGLSPDGGWARELAHRWPEVQCLVIADHRSTSVGDWPEAFHLVCRLSPIEVLGRTIGGALRQYQLERECRRLRAERALYQPTVQARLAAHRLRMREAGRFETIIRAPGSPLEPLCDMAARIAGFDVPVLVMGESGTGKELMARAIHASSLRSEMPFYALDCGAVTDELLESELFGHCKGAFTGASSSRVGLLERAHEGTLLLDEIGDTSSAFQLRLLRFLQEGEVRPVGTNEVRQLDVRVIAATNRDLMAEVAAGRFREDLYHRLTVAPVELPPLRERACDIAALAEVLLARIASRHGVRVGGFTEEAMACLCAYSWPGNVRELENQITRMVMLATGEKLGVELLSPHLRTDEWRQQPVERRQDLQPPPKETTTAAQNEDAGTLREQVERLEARCLAQALERHGGNKSRTASELGLSRIGLRAKLQRYGIGEAASDPE